MNADLQIYLVFGLVVFVSLIADLGLLSRKNAVVSIRKALLQTLFWVLIAIGFFVFLWNNKGQYMALQYLSAYLMEWSLSIDNIFVFILIFSAFRIQPRHYGRALIWGIIMAVLFRIIFITLGVTLVTRFEWILYIFGVFLLYTGIKLFFYQEEDAFEPKDSAIYKFLNRFLPLASHDGDGRYVIRENNKPLYTTLFVAVVMLGATDLLFALDSIPAVMGISQDRLVIYSSNTFAVLGLRSLFFLLKGAVSKFDYLEQGIALVLIFIGLKMLLAHWIDNFINKDQQVILSLAFIILCISGSVFYSILHQKKGLPPDQST
jgi:tellurite resistance protein TerC